MAMVIIPVFVGWMPIAITAIAGATLMVSTKCLRNLLAYRFIEWKAVFLNRRHASVGNRDAGNKYTYLTQGLLSMVGNQGPWVVVASLYIITSLGNHHHTNGSPRRPNVAHSNPIIGVSSHLAPQHHDGYRVGRFGELHQPYIPPRQYTCYGSRGYRFNDYLKVGIPLAFVVFLTAMSVLPFMWP